ARDRRRRAVQLPLLLERFLRAAAVHRREPGPLDPVGRALAVPHPAPGAVEPDDGGDDPVHGAGDRALLRRPTGVRRRRDVDGGQGMTGLKVAVIGGGSTYTPELVSGLGRERERLEIAELSLCDTDRERREVVGGLAARMLEAQGFAGRLTLTGDLDRAV